jgi:hypothetical protein
MFLIVLALPWLKRRSISLWLECSEISVFAFLFAVEKLLTFVRADATDANGQKRRKEEMPVFEQAENVDNPLRCPVKLYEFYLSKWFVVLALLPA